MEIMVCASPKVCDSRKASSDLILAKIIAEEFGIIAREIMARENKCSKSPYKDDNEQTNKF